MADGGIPHGRDYAETLRRLGARDRTDLALFPRSELVAQIDDLTALAPPLLVAQCGCGASIAPGAANYPVLEVQSLSQNGIWITSASCQGAGAWLAIGSVSFILAGAFSVNPTQWGGFYNLQSTATAGTRNVNPASAFPFHIPSNQTWDGHLQAYVPRGSFASLIGDTANTTAILAICWRECP